MDVGEYSESVHQFLKEIKWFIVKLLLQHLWSCLLVFTASRSGSDDAVVVVVVVMMLHPACEPADFGQRFAESI